MEDDGRYARNLQKEKIEEKLGFGKYKEDYQEFLMKQIEDKTWVTQ